MTEPPRPAWSVRTACRQAIQILALVLSPWLPAPAWAQVMSGGLGTLVNGTAEGSCASGACQVEGGTTAGSNLFHRFRQFDTRGGISGVSIDSRGLANVIVGVTNPAGTFLNRPLSLTQQANLFWLSPGGIWVGPGADLVRVSNLLLTTATALPLEGGATFDDLRTTAQEASGYPGAPSTGWTTLTSLASLADLGLKEPGPIVLAGGRLRVDRALVMDGANGDVRALTGAGSRLEAGERVRLSGRALDLDALTISAGEPGQRGPVILQTTSRATGEDSGAIRLSNSHLEGSKVILRAGAVTVAGSTLAAPKGVIRLESTNARGDNGILLSNARLDVGVHTLEDLRAGGSVTIEKQDGTTVLEGAPTPLIHLFSQGDVLVEADSTLTASQDLSPIRAALLREGGVPLADSDVKLADTSGNVVLDAAGRIGVSRSKLLADASDNLAGNLALVARGGEGRGGISIDQSTLSASGGAGSGDIRLGSSDGIAITGSTLLTESSHGPGSREGGIDWASVFTLDSLYPFAAGEITLSNDSPNRPVVINGSRLEANYHTREGGLSVGFPNPGGQGNGPVEFLDLDDDRDLVRPSFDWTLDPPGLAGIFPRSLVAIISAGGVSISNGSTLDAGSHPAGQPDLLEAFGGRVLVVNTGTGPGAGALSITDSTLLSRVDSASSIRFPNPDFPDFSAQESLPIGEPGSVQLWSAGSLHLSNSSVDVGDAGRIIRAGDAIGPPPSPVRDPYADPGSQDPSPPQAILEQLARGIRGVGESARQTVIVDPDNRVKVVTTDPEGGITVLRDPSPQLLTTLVGEERAAALLTRGLLTAPLIVAAGPGAGPADSSRNTTPLKRESTSLERESTPLKRESTPQSVATSSSFTSMPASFSSLEAAEASRAFAQAVERSRQETIAGLGLEAGKGTAEPSSEQLQLQLQRISAALSLPSPYRATSYRPAIVLLNLSKRAGAEVALDLLYLPPKGPMKGWRVEMPEAQLRGWITSFQRQISRMEEIDGTTQGAGRQLSNHLLTPLLPTLRHDGITALLLSVDRGLQAIPYAALPLDDGRPLGETFSLTLTPSLGLTALDAASNLTAGRMLLAGTSNFKNGLAHLPLVRHELETLAAEHPADLLLDDAFSSAALLEQAGRRDYRRVHLASHAEFRPGPPPIARIFTATGEVSLTQLGRRLQSGPAKGGVDLVSLSACRTTLGDESSELGLVGLALRTGSRSGLGTLWFVDDAASAGFFVQFYRQLARGLSKDEALQSTRRAFRNGEIRVRGDSLVGPDGSPLIQGLSQGDRARFAEGLSHPYFWAGVVLSGSPW
jgi:CHAT domain-containing protein